MVRLSAVCSSWRRFRVLRVSSSLGAWVCGRGFGDCFLCALSSACLSTSSRTNPVAVTINSRYTPPDHACFSLVCSRRGGGGGGIGYARRAILRASRRGWRLSAVPSPLCHSNVFRVSTNPVVQRLVRVRSGQGKHGAGTPSPPLAPLRGFVERFVSGLKPSWGISVASSVLPAVTLRREYDGWRRF